MAIHNIDKKGRSKAERFSFVRLPNYLLDSPAWLELTSPAKAILVQLSRRYNGFNNGKIGVTTETLSRECRVAKNTITSAIKILIEHGLLEITFKGSFNLKKTHASEYRLTWLKCDLENQPALNQWQNYQPKFIKPIDNQTINPPYRVW